jgi:peptidoglycan/LPS O-acetylase OafA/YrhL
MTPVSASTSSPEPAAPLTEQPADAPAPAARTERASRTESIDVIRLIAAAGIIFVHAAKSEPLISIGHLFRFAVPFYLFASLYFQSQSLRRNSDRPLGKYIASRFRRLYLPFLAWSIIYLLARNVRHLTVLRSGLVDLEFGMLWRGTEYHLWFLPFLLIWSIILAVAHWGLLRRNRAWRWPLIFVTVAAGLAVAFIPMPSSWNEVFPSTTYAYVQWWRALPAACWGFAFALFMTMGPRIYEVPWYLGVGGIVLTVVCSIQQALYGIQLIPRALTGLGCMLTSLMPWSRGRVVTVLAHFGRYSYGIYLCHVLVLEAIRQVTHKCHLDASTPVDFATFVLGFGGSLGLVYALGRSRRTAWLNG